MALRQEHELHARKRGLNRAVGLLLVAFIGLIFALTFVKITSDGFQFPPTPEEASQ